VAGGTVFVAGIGVTWPVARNTKPARSCLLAAAVAAELLMAATVSPNAWFGDSS
jgi:hypothetical protein